MFDVYQSRLEFEAEFLSAALTGIAQKTIKPSDAISACPLWCLSPGTKQHTIYAAIEWLFTNGLPVNLASIWEHIRIKQNGPSEKTSDAPVWSLVSAADIADFTMSILGSREESIMHYARIVRNEALKRRAEGKILGIAMECRKLGNDTSEIASSLTGIIGDLEGGIPEEHTIDGVLERMIMALENGGAAKPMPTPWPDLNRVLKGGFVAGELVILAGRPGTGKTAFAGCVAVETAKMEKSVLFISREVSEYTVASRITAREGRIDMRYFRQGIEHAPDIIPKIQSARSTLNGLPLRIVEKSTAPMTPSEVRRLAKTTKGVGLIVVDYLQLMIPDSKQQSREREIADMTRYFKQMAMDCECPVLLLSQLNRKSEEGDRPPQLSDLRESGAIEQDADIVIMLYTRKIDTSQSRPPVQAIVSKGRSSGTGKACLRFNKPFADFEEDNSAGEVLSRSTAIGFE